MICLDTTFLIDYFKERVIITDEIKNHLEGIVSITPFSIFELYHGIYRLKRKDPSFNFKQREKKILEFLNLFHLLNYNDKTAIKTAEILNYLEGQGSIIDIIDIMIASTALTNDYKLILTRNESHFQKIPGVSIISYELKT